MSVAFNLLAKFHATGFQAIALGNDRSSNIIFLLTGASTSAAAIVAELPAEPPVGSIYFTPDGKQFVHATAGTAAGNWIADASSASATITALVATSLDVGASGTAGSLDLFPATASKGKIAFTATNNAGNTTTTITNAAFGQASTLTIPDPGGAAASFVLTEGAQTINSVKTFGSAPVLPGASITAAPTTTVGIGAPVANKATAVEYGEGLVHKTVLTFTLTGANDLDLADGGAHGTGVKVYDMPEGRILLLGATVNATIATTGVNATPNNALLMAMGTAAQGDDATLATTDVDIIPETSCAITDNAGAFKAALGSSAQFDGTTTAKDVYLNAAIIDANSGAAVTVAVTGTATLTWVNLGDY